MGKSHSEEHNGHVCSSVVMCSYGIGGSRGKAAEIINVVTPFVAVVEGVGGVQ